MGQRIYITDRKGIQEKLDFENLTDFGQYLLTARKPNCDKTIQLALIYKEDSDKIVKDSLLQKEIIFLSPIDNIAFVRCLVAPSMIETGNDYTFKIERSLIIKDEWQPICNSKFTLEAIQLKIEKIEKVEFCVTDFD